MKCLVCAVCLMVLTNVLYSQSKDKIQHRLLANFGLQPEDSWVLVDVSDQQLHLIKNGKTLASYPVSTSKYGIGAKEGSNKTPLGVHSISQKIGKGAASGSIFKGRLNTGKVAEIVHDTIKDANDYVTTRILWLSGLEPSINKGSGIDSHNRYIYIHGTHEEGLIGQPASHGCIRMKNKDVIELFRMVEEGTLVYISQ